MKRLSFFLSVLVAIMAMGGRAVAQPGIVNTIAGGGTSTAEGAAALTASITPTYLDVDDAGNVYFKSGEYIKKYVAATGRIYTVAGNGTAGYTGDGGSATNAAIAMRDLCVDGAGNIYIADADHAVVRKVMAATGIISTLSIPLADDPWGIGNGPDGNIYIVNMMSSGGVNDVVKYDPLTGVSSTIFSSSSSWQKTSVCINIWGDIFLGSAPGNMWKRDANTGIVSSFGSGPGTISGKMDIDNAGNIYCVGTASGHIKKVNAWGIAEFISNTTASYNNDDIDGLHISKIRTSPQDICVDRHGNLYYANGVCIRKVIGYSSGVVSATGNFCAYAAQKCEGVSIRVGRNSTFAATSMLTDFGDGTSSFVSLPTASVINIEHIYSASATYTIKHTLYSGVLPVDSNAYSHVYNFCRTRSLALFYDENTDCIRDFSEHAIGVPSKIIVDSNGVSIDTINVISGCSFDAYGGPGDIYTFRIPSTSNFNVLCPSSGAIFDTLSTTVSHISKSFAIVCGTSSLFDFATYVSARAGSHSFRANIIVNNLYCASVASSLTVSNFKYPYHSSSITPASYVGAVGQWDFSGVNALTAVSASKYLSLSLECITSFICYLAGDTTMLSTTISPISGDVAPSNNIVIRIDTVKSSFDPNYIEVNPSGCIPKEPTELTYTIGFENTGNDTAHNIYVLDTIPNSLDISSFQPLAASHEMHVYKYDLGGGYVIRFDFPNIMLPDSSHHDFCHGMFVYKIKTKGATLSRVRVGNRVGIYFDENEVVMTNTAENEIGCPVTGIAQPEKPLSVSNYTSLFPNPTTGELTIKTDGQTFSSFTITNAVGQQVWQQAIGKAQERVDLGHLPAGFYYVTLRGEQGSEVRKFVKW